VNDAFTEMKRRGYRMGRRAESAARTRSRIVEATMAVHDEQGITRTSVRDVAARAGVAPATVLNHFPTMRELISACGAASDEQYPMPTEAVLVGARDHVDAVRLAARALFTWWEQIGPGWDHLQVDRRTLPEIEEWLRDVERQRRSLIATAAGPVASPAELTVLTALTSHGAWRSLRDGGLDIDRAATEVARTFTGSASRRASSTRRQNH
jgi:AcrR family transcriptional regulator